MRRVLVIGATSAIVEATCRHLAADGDALFLTGRSESRLAAVAADFETRGAPRVGTAVLDATDAEGRDRVTDEAWAFLGGIDLAVIGHGMMPDPDAAQTDPGAVSETFDVNAVSVACLMTGLAERMRESGGGRLVVISSVAGDRPRASNHVYGAAKAAVSHFARGLAARLAGSGVSVLVVKPAFVDTPMTAGLEKGLLWTTPERAGRGIHAAIAGGREVVYVPWFWRWIMLVIRLMPEWLLRRLNL